MMMVEDSEAKNIGLCPGEMWGGGVEVGWATGRIPGQ